MGKDERTIAGLDREKVLALVKERLKAGQKPMEIINSLQEGMVEVGNLFEKGEIFISELILCGEIMKEVMDDLEPQLATGDREYRGTVVIGTVKGDIHDLGKNIVVMLLRGAGYKVVDLGADVAPKVCAVRQGNANSPCSDEHATHLLHGLNEGMRAGGKTVGSKRQGVNRRADYRRQSHGI